MAFFENEENIQTAFEALVIDKEETAGLDENIYRVIKYVLRNFPNNPKILDNIFNLLKNALPSRKVVCLFSSGQ